MTDVFSPQSPSDARQVVRSFNDDGSANFSQVGVEEIDYRGRFGALGTSTTENDISIGEKYFTLDVDDGKIRTGDDVLLISLDDSDCYMWGEVIGTDTVAEPLRLRIFVDDISAITNTSTNWEIQVVARPKPGIEKDTSLTSFDPTDGGPWTLTVTSGKFFPIGGTLLLKPTTDRTIAIIGEVKAYSSTSLTVSLRSTNATVPTSYDSWSIALLDSPPAKQPFLDVVGLRVTQNATDAFAIDIAPGSIMDSTGDVLLTLETALTKTLDDYFATGDGVGCVVQTGNLTGTITKPSSNATVTGSGTSFLAEFDSATITEFDDLGGDFLENPGRRWPILDSSASRTVSVTSVTNDTSLESSDFPNAITAGSTFKRGGSLTNVRVGGDTYYFIHLVRRDSDGLVDVIASSATPSGLPDLPTGFSLYRFLAAIHIDKGSPESDSEFQVYQPIYGSMFPFAADALNYVLLGEVALSNVPNSYQLVNSTSVTQGLTLSPTRTVSLQRAALTGDVTASVNSNATTIANDAVTNAKLANMAAYTFKGRNDGTSGDPSDIDITALTAKATPVAGDYVLITDSAASNAFKKVDVSTLGGGTTFPTDMGLITEAATTTYDLGTIV